MPGTVPFYGGISGLQIPIPKRDFPPAHQDKSRMAFYATLFNSIEINSSFYKMPQAKTLAKWSTDVPADFKFTFKLWQGITHNKGLFFDTDDVFKFVEIINSVGLKKGSLLLQFPPSLSIAATDQLEYLFNTLVQADPQRGWKVAVEFRNKSWYQDEVFELLERHRVAMVLHDLPASAAPLLVTAEDFTYLRFHGPNGGYRGSYSDEFLSEFATYINEWQQDGKIVYTYFNNTMGKALDNLLTLKRYLADNRI